MIELSRRVQHTVTFFADVGNWNASAR
jgi:hypothetical protein